MIAVPPGSVSYLSVRRENSESVLPCRIDFSSPEWLGGRLFHRDQKVLGMTEPFGFPFVPAVPRKPFRRAGILGTICAKAKDRLSPTVNFRRSLKQLDSARTRVRARKRSISFHLVSLSPKLVRFLLIQLLLFQKSIFLSCTSRTHNLEAQLKGGTRP